MIPYLQVEGLTRFWGELVLFEDLNFTIAQGQKVAFLAIVDTCRPGYKRRLSFLKRIYLHLNYIGQRRSKYIYHKAKSFYQHAKFYIKQIFQNHNQKKSQNHIQQKKTIFIKQNQDY